MKKANTQAAHQLGVTAFEQGVPRIPAQCPGMVALLQGRDMGGPRTTKELLAWIAGWTQASLVS